MSAHARSSVAQERRGKVGSGTGGKAPSKLSNIWIVKPILESSTVTLIGDIRFHHFFACEGDPRVRFASYGAAARAHERITDPLRVDASVRTVDGQLVWHRVELSAEWSRRIDIGAHESAAQSAGASFRLVTADDLDQVRMRIDNWTRLTAAHRRCRHLPAVRILQSVILTLLSDGATHRLGRILTSLDGEHPTCVLGSIAELLRKRLISADIDRLPWGYNTALRMESPT